MTYANMDLQSLPSVIELRVGTDPAERALQLSYYHCWSALQALNIIDDASTYPEQVINAGAQTTFATALDNLLVDLAAAVQHFEEIWVLVPSS